MPSAGAAPILKKCTPGMRSGHSVMIKYVHYHSSKSSVISDTQDDPRHCDRCTRAIPAATLHAHCITCDSSPGFDLVSSFLNEVLLQSRELLADMRECEGCVDVDAIAGHIGHLFVGLLSPL